MKNKENTEKNRVIARVFSPKKEFSQKYGVSKEKYDKYVDSLDEAHRCFNEKTAELGKFHSEAQRASEMELANMIVR